MTKKNFELVTGAAIMLLGLAVFLGGMIIEPGGNTLFWLIAAVSLMGALNLLAKRWQDRNK